MLNKKYLLEPLDLAQDELEELFALAEDIIENPVKYSESCKGKIMATLFYEPSTRTRLSFESAMLRLGGNVLGFSDANSSSASKGETIADTTQMVNGYSDIVVMRHPYEGAPKIAAANSIIPVINAGDGGHQHPTQTLTDMLTIHREKGSFNNLTIGFCGDLKYGRTVHSLIKAMARYEGVCFILISPEELAIPEYIKKDILDKNNIPYTQVSDMESVIGKVDILYMTRVQRERFEDIEQYNRLKDSYVLDKEKMSFAKEDMMVLHPLPRVNEIALEVDDDPRAKYFVQAKNGVFARMALILMLLEASENNKEKAYSYPTNVINNQHKCQNPKCATAIESSAAQLFHPIVGHVGEYCCEYCDHIVKE